MEVASVSSTSVRLWNTGGVGIYGAIHMWNSMYVNDTVLLRPKDYPWAIFQIIVKLKKRGFPWVLYARKLRERR